MLDIKFIRDHRDLVARAVKLKHVECDVDRLLAVDDRRKVLLGRIEERRADQNVSNNKIVQASAEERSIILEKMKVLKSELELEEVELKEVMREWQILMLKVPNVPDSSVPTGESDADNEEVKRWGEIPKFDFEPKGHMELMTSLGMADFERGVKVAGFRGYFLKGSGAMLSFAIWRYALDFFVSRGFSLYLAPSMVRREPLMGTGYLPQSEDDLYKVQDDKYLSGTSEVAIMGLFQDELISKEELPKKILAFSPCFRREIGSHSKDVKGLIRVHEFFKFEQVIFCEASHEQSVQYHEELNRNTEEFIESLKIPYRTVVNCGGDLGLGQVKKYDVELWVPCEQTYREISSTSYFHDFQTRRLNTRYKDSDGKSQYAHSLNATAAPTPRLLVSLVENFQQADGAVKIPDVLVPYMNGLSSIQVQK